MVTINCIQTQPNNDQQGLDSRSFTEPSVQWIDYNPNNNKKILLSRLFAYPLLFYFAQFRSTFHKSMPTKMHILHMAHLKVPLFCFFFLIGFGFVCFSNPNCPPRSPIGLVPCVPTYTLSSPAFEGVTRRMSFKHTSPPPCYPRYMKLRPGTWSTQIKGCQPPASGQFNDLSRSLPFCVQSKTINVIRRLINQNFL